ncbi:zinc finger MYM-type protein 1-like [Acyrthosiphon pisum]|uniref:DUF4371 domain-containing protein n=1 Tax=Acyrthosiphon pisum TaxID=7029 RepID=A0A8R2B9D2_ACYPI|nr:zinc finger MYM-type protein 1-like [Acyrthosiphon pisum]|eukprot:XP_008187309.1 PREDICTED: zinc finger MYM-type protein 1-like [Acyrthosiphon pisum]
MYINVIAQVCSLQFDSSDYEKPLIQRMLEYSPKHQRKLKPNAVPSNYLCEIGMVHPRLPVERADVSTQCGDSLNEVETGCSFLFFEVHICDFVDVVTDSLCKEEKLSIIDPATWTDNNMTQHIRAEVVKFGPYQVKDFDFPYSVIDGTKRKFSTFYYTRKLINCEIIERHWLVYSKSCDRVFCFCCKLFSSSGPQQSLLSTIGTNNWKCLSENLKSHERSSLHLKSVQIWMELKLRISENSTIDKAYQSAIEKEKQHWKNVMIRIIAAIQYLAKHNDAFRGSSDVVNTENNGKFIGIIEMMGKFDPTIMEHLHRIKNKETRIHYLGHDIQNELIELMATEVKTNILQKIKLAKYYAIIMDCTPDISRHEQLSLVIRIVDMNSENEGTNPEIKEYFMDFVNIISSTGLNLSEVLLQKLAEYQIPVENCRAQCYDNGANMAGQYKGVQARLLNQNPRAFFMPCAAHRLNLVIGDAVKSSTRAIHFFGTIERIYTIFAASTGRWMIFTKHCHRWTVKRWSETRWESRHDSIKSVRFQFKEIIEALDEVSETTNDSLIKSETHSLVSEISKYEFLISLCVWYTVLKEVNIVSKSVQGPNTNLDTYATLLNALIKFMGEYRETGFNQAKLEAKELAESLEIETEFKVPRYRKKKKLFEYEVLNKIY